jgi:hypothetical protein
MEEERLSRTAPGRLSALLSQGLRGHHPLFERDQILAAFELPDHPVAEDDAEEIGEVLLAICRDPVSVARAEIARRSQPVRLALVRLYFRLLDRVEEERESLQ